MCVSITPSTKSLTAAARTSGPVKRARTSAAASICSSSGWSGSSIAVEAEPRRQLVRVLEPPVGVEHRLPRVHAGLVHERGAVPRRDLALEVPQRLRPLRDRVLRQRPLHPRERLVEQALGRAVRQPLDDGAVPAGIVPADPGAPQQLAVDPLRVHVVVVQADGRSGTTRSMAAAVISSMGTMVGYQPPPRMAGSSGCSAAKRASRSRHSCTERQSASLTSKSSTVANDGCRCASAKPGRTRRPPRSTVRVRGPAHSAASAALPSATIRPSLTARASWRERRASTVYTIAAGQDQIRLHPRAPLGQSCRHQYATSGTNRFVHSTAAGHSRRRRRRAAVRRRRRRAPA